MSAIRKTAHLFKSKTNDPQGYYWFKSGLSHSDVDKVISYCQGLKTKKASTLRDSEGGDIRRSKITWIPKTDDNWWLYEALINMADEANEQMWNFNLYEAVEDIQYTEYHASENGHYDWHQDLGIGDLPSRRKVSITIQLSESDEYEGGELLICTGSNGNGELDNNIVCPRGKGVAVLFPSYMMHRVTPVTKGVRKSLVLWVGGEHFR